MAKKSRRATPPPSISSSAAQWGSSLARGLFQPARLIVLVAAVVTAVLIRIAVGWLPDLGERDEYMINAETIAVTEPPRYVPPDFVAAALHTADLPEQMSLLDDGVTQDIYDALSRHPWVAQVNSVAKQPPGRIVAELEYRRPIAMVEVPRGVYPIDPVGILLPPEDFTVADAKRYLLVTGVTSTPQGPQGTDWGDPAVAGAAELATLLQDSGQEFGFSRINCRTNRLDGTPEFELYSAGGSRIMWGCAPSKDRPGEPTSDQKMQRLQKYLKHFGDFEKPDGPYEIDIRHWQEISRTPLAALSPGPRR